MPAKAGIHDFLPANVHCTSGAQKTYAPPPSSPAKAGDPRLPASVLLTFVMPAKAGIHDFLPANVHCAFGAQKTYAPPPSSPAKAGDPRLPASVLLTFVMPAKAGIHDSLFSKRVFFQQPYPTRQAQAFLFKKTLLNPARWCGNAVAHPTHQQKTVAKRPVCRRHSDTPAPDSKKFFGSFLQKRTACFHPCLQSPAPRPSRSCLIPSSTVGAFIFSTKNQMMPITI